MFQLKLAFGTIMYEYTLGVGCCLGWKHKIKILSEEHGSGATFCQADWQLISSFVLHQSLMKVWLELLDA